MLMYEVRYTSFEEDYLVILVCTSPRLVLFFLFLEELNQ
jgi:hypothetical protein